MTEKEVLEIIEQAHHLRLESVHHPAVATAGQILFELEHKPERPVRNKPAAGVVRGVAHRQHALWQGGKALRQQIVFEEVLFDQRITS